MNKIKDIIGTDKAILSLFGSKVYDFIKGAFDKPIIDLDNFPDIYDISSCSNG